MPYNGSKQYADGTTVHFWLMTETSGEMQQMCGTQGLDTECAAKAECRRQEILAERLLLRRVFGETSVNFDHRDDGLPFLSGGAYISIAHTRGILCVAVNGDHATGIDVERYGRRVLNVRDGFLTDDEKAWLKSDDELAHIVAWTIKESMFKIAGTRDMDYKHELQLLPFAVTDGTTRLLVGGRFRNTAYTNEVELGEKYIFTITYPKQYTK